VARGRAASLVSRDLADELLDVLSHASLGRLHVRVDVDEADLEEPLALIGNAVNVLLDDLAYRQQEREDAVAVAVEARAKEEFLAYLSHDMQTPLALLLGTLSLLEDSPDQEELEATLPILRRAGNRLERFVQQFLDLARLGADRPLVVQLRTVDLAHAIGHVVDLFADKGPIDLVVDEEATTAYADEDRVEQILANLVGNAYKHAGEEPQVSIRTDRTDAGVRVHVSDRGRGMSEEDLARVFTKFERGASPSRAAGTGLGLYLSRALAEAQDGTLTVESELGKGSRFTLTLPARPPIPR
jgi:signal transduction histidine kinase